MPRVSEKLDGFFRLTENGTSVRTELLAGATTFLTMAYIIFLQPAILSGGIAGVKTGMDFGAVMVATCVAAALATAIMGLYARYPIAQAPGMGENFFFVALVTGAAASYGNGWEVALGVIFVSGLLFLLLSVLGVREAIIEAVSPSMRNAMAVGIGLFIAFIGMRNVHLVVADPGNLVQLNPDFARVGLAVFFFGLVLTAVLHVRGMRGAILWGILGTTLLCTVLKLAGVTEMGAFKVASGIVEAPPSLAPTFFKMDAAAALTPMMLPYVIVFLFMDMFDTLGTLIGVSERAGFIKDNKLPRAKQALISDAVGTVAGACLGTSTVTSFIESAAGVEQGGRTGLTSVTVAVMFLLALFFAPLVAMVGSYAPITAPALVIVGTMMLANVKNIRWDDYSEAVPAFLTMVGIPLFSSIADGLAVGFISYPIIKSLSGRSREVSWVMCVLAVVLLAYFLFVRTGLAV